MSWRQSQGFFIYAVLLCNAQFSIRLILTTLFSYLMHMENIYSVGAVGCFSSPAYFYMYRSISNIMYLKEKQKFCLIY